jgi:hypothetical protein
MPATPLIESLHGLRRRVRFFSIAYGVGIALAALVGLLISIVLIDFALNLSPMPRAVVMLSALAAVGYVIYRWIIRPARAKLGIGDIAGRVESVYPQFEDRLRSTVDFVRGDGGTIPGSEPMKRATVAEACRQAAGIDFGKVVNTTPAWYATAVAAGALVLLLALGFLLPRAYVTTALSRLGLGSQPWPKSVEIAMLKNTPTRVPVGQRVDVQMKLAKGDRDSRKAVIYYRYDNGPWQQELMKRGGDGVYASSLDARIDAAKNSGTLEIKMVSGDDTKILAPVSIVPRLDISRIVANITAPPYAGATKTSVNLTERPAVMPIGAGVELRAEFNKPLDPSTQVTLVMADATESAPAVKWNAGANIATGMFEAAKSIRFSIGARDQDGFENTAAQQFELIVREDGVPTVQIEEPRRSEERTPTAAFPLRAVAEDDYGIATAHLVVQRIGRASSSASDGSQPATAPAVLANAQDVNKKWVIPLLENSIAATGVGWEPAGASGDRKRYRLDYLWDLGKLAGADLKPGDVLEYFIQVKDNFSLAGREHEFVPSGKLRITIISQEQWAKNVQIEVEQVGNEIRQIRQGQSRTKLETGELIKQATESGKFDEAHKAAAERLANQQGMTASQTAQSAKKLDQLVSRMAENRSPEGGVKQTAKEVSDRLEKLADGEMREAGKNLNDAKDKKIDPKASPDEEKQDAEQRGAELGKSVENQEASEEKLQSAMDKLGDFSTLGDMISRLEGIKAQQKEIGKKFNENAKNNLGKKPEDMAKDARDKNDEAAREQDAVQKKTQQMLADMEKKSGDMEKSDAAKSKAMKEAAKSGSPVPQKQQQNSQSMQQNQQAQAQQAQKEIELGLEMILQKLKDAERRELQELRKQLAEIEQLVAELIRRQAGHNLDNLTISNPKKLLEMSKADRDVLMEKAQRDEANMPPPPAQAELSPSQETTERNARDVAKKSETLPNPAPAAKLSAAAGHMELAIVYLRGGKLPEAYDPPQVEALKSLDAAMEIIQKELEDAEKELDQQDRDTIRQAFTKLLDDQKKLNSETRDIHAKRGADGNLPREVDVRLGQMPAAQGGLVERAEAIGKDLKALKSIVYDWANREIGKSMEDVKQQLGNRSTGEATQAQQAKIEQQVQSLIDNLKTTPPKPEKFAKRQDGGGGQGAAGKKPPPSMPTEAELRLLKEFQNAVNQTTKAIDAAGKKDAQDALVLGGRQGDLRNLLDELMKQATQGKVELGPEPDNKDQLPEEAREEDVDNQELDQELLGNGKDEPEADAVVEKVKKTGARMARARQRLALNNDSGKVTQMIQERIVFDMDELIKESQRQQQQGQASSQKSKAGEQQKPKPGEQSQQQASKEQKGEDMPANDSTAGLNVKDQKEAELSKNYEERAEEWGKLFDRRREAVMEGGGQNVIRKYRQFVDDYYRSLSEKASE